MRDDTDIAIVSWACTPFVRQTSESETQLLLHAITNALEPIGLTRADIDFTCAGSCDYISGATFSFVQNLDAIGAWPPKRDSHVEMDGAWAMYEAWLRLHHGDIDIAVVTGSGRSSTANPSLIYPMEMDPYYLAPLGVDPISFAAFQARALIDAGKITERQMAEVAARSRKDAMGTPGAQVTGDFDVDKLLEEDYVRAPLRRHDLPPISDGACAVVLATAKRAQELVERPGVDHGARAPHRSATTPRCATSPTRRRPVPRQKPPVCRTGRSTSPSCRRRSPTRSCCSPRCSGSPTGCP